MRDATILATVSGCRRKLAERLDKIIAGKFETEASAKVVAILVGQLIELCTFERELTKPDVTRPSPLKGIAEGRGAA